MAAKRLEAHLYGRHVADIVDAGDGECAVQYTNEGISAGAPARLSLALPPRELLYPSTGHGTRWVRSLLPEGRALAWAVTAFGIPEDDRFALLAEIGSDVAGAARIFAAGEVPDASEAYDQLDDAALATLAARAHDRPLGLDAERGVRLSLAGVQDKLVLHRPLRSRSYYLPRNGAASTVIIKPQPPEPENGGLTTPGLVANEALCLHLATTAGLDAASARVETFGGIACLAVDRFDRRRVTGGVQRVHAEDLLTAMGRDPHLKYERGNQITLARAGGFADTRPTENRPGPGLDDIAEFLSRHLGRGVLAKIVEIVTFNIAIGNADAHARNLSLLLAPDGEVTLAPLYDVVCTRHYVDVNSDAAQLVNDIDDIDDIGIDDIVAHAARWETGPLAERRATRLLERMSERLDTAVALTIDAGADPNDTAAVAQTIAERLRHMT